MTAILKAAVQGPTGRSIAACLFRCALVVISKAISGHATASPACADNRSTLQSHE